MSAPTAVLDSSPKSLQGKRCVIVALHQVWFLNSKLVSRYAPSVLDNLLQFIPHLNVLGGYAIPLYVLGISSYHLTTKNEGNRQPLEGRSGASVIINQPINQALAWRGHCTTLTRPFEGHRACFHRTLPQLLSYHY